MQRPNSKFPWDKQDFATQIATGQGRALQLQPLAKPREKRKKSKVKRTQQLDEEEQKENEETEVSQHVDVLV